MNEVIFVLLVVFVVTIGFDPIHNMGTRGYFWKVLLPKWLVSIYVLGQVAGGHANVTTLLVIPAIFACEIFCKALDQIISPRLKVPTN